jgi:hypothetical protein
MPKPIVCIAEQLRQFLELFCPCFSKRQWRYFVIILLGLVECEERKTMTGLLRVVGERISLSGLSRFMNRWPWEATKVADVWLRRFRLRMKEVVQKDHRTNLLYWLQEKLKSGDSVDQICSQLALFNS